ncbi:hypothetical protein AB0L83_20780 [Streptomyces sp. NPDC052071]|uniref:VMAP-C domain-containing protein n=1 Tax=Streptomyces TaxID=1883 RepID=UPI002E112473|nr:caspase family protein [[Kitasatospora] papulosa]
MTGSFTPPVDLVPERVHALVVGVETYQVSPQWDLPGAGRDAVRFADWLTGTAGVPPDNVRLLLSPPARAAEGLSELSYAIRDATRENVCTVMFDELPACEGDLLWIYWAGHGYIDTGDRLLLPCQNATANLTRHFNLGSALHWWRSDAIKRGKFPFQVAITDACRIDAAAQPGLNFGTGDSYGGKKSDPDRRQFVLYASRRGEVAGNIAERGAGQFTDKLLQRLAGVGLAEAVWNLDGIARQVVADFAEEREAGLAWQHPEFTHERGWDGLPIFGQSWADPAQRNQAPCLDQQAWNELGDLLRDMQLPPFTYDAYRWAFEISGCAPPVTRALPSTDLVGIARDLDRRQGGTGCMALALPFVRHLARTSCDPAWAGKAGTWVDATVVRTGMDPVPPAPGLPTEKPTLHLRLAVDPQNDALYWARLWIHGAQGAFESIWESQRAITLREVRAQMAQEINAMTAGVDQAQRGFARIEFDVPYALLDEEFERWKLPIGRPGRPPRELGHHYEVVLRCLDERVGIAADSWRRKWDWFKAHGGQNSQAMRRLVDEDINATLDLVLTKDASPVCVLAEVSDTRVADTIDAILDAGMPIAVWPRARTQPSTDGNENAVTHVDDVWTLPKNVRDGRIAAQRRPLALLWDDPDRIPDNRFAVVAYGAQEGTTEA